MNLNIYVTDSNFIIENTQGKKSECNVDNTMKIPTIPWYHIIWEADTLQICAQIMKKAMKEVLKFSIRKSHVNVYIPSDFSIVDRKCIEEFIYGTSLVRQQRIFPFAEHPKAKQNNGIYLTSTNRVITIETYENGKNTQTQYFNHYTVSKEAIIKCIDHLPKLPLFILDINHQLQDYYSLGESINILPD